MAGQILPGGAETGHRRPNHFAGGALDRAATRRLDPEWIAACRNDPDARVVPVWRERSLVRAAASDAGDVAFEPVLLSPGRARGSAAPETDWAFLGLSGGRPIFAAEITGREDAAGGSVDAGDTAGDGDVEPPLPELGEFHDLHRIGAMLAREEGSLLAYARAMTTWSARHRFCGSCGAPTRPLEGGHQRECTDDACGLRQFPRTDPAIIVLVADGDRCLLGRKDIWPEGVYSTLAGFVEPGESLSEAVAREVREESGIEVGEVRYRSSQPWPFPSSLMLGFHALRVGGTLRVDEHELADARWFGREELEARKDSGLRLPSRVSIARRLIQEWLRGAR